jgi:4'-phosphopantetheinyl transferase
MSLYGLLPCSPLPLEKGEVCVWHASLDRIGLDGAEINRILANDERRRASHFAFALNRKRYEIRRAVLRILLGAYLERRPEDITFSYNSYGKPMLEDSDLSFNMSETAGIAVYAVARNRSVGADAERIREFSQMTQIAQRFFTKCEYDLLCATPEDGMAKRFFEYWTRKEAVFKAIGKGLSIPLNSIDVSGNIKGQILLVQKGTGPARSQKWAVQDIELDGKNVAALAVEWPCSLPPKVHSLS